MNYRFKSYIKFYLNFWIIILIVWSCAKPVSPTGGPKDETPPKITKSIPANGTTNFHGEEIVISFDEYVNLKDINSQLIISPPVRETPDFKLKGKSLLIKFKEPRRAETTYNIFFGNAIQDITENNALAGYKFTFSTGNVLDSMMIEGKVINSYTLAPVKSAYVMLYDSVYDSVPYKQLPYYIARTNDNGEFELTNLRNISYKIFALTDINANYLYDQPNEEIAFIDSLIHPWNVEIPSLLKHGLNHGDTTLMADSVVLRIRNDSIAITDTIKASPVQDSTAMKTDSLMVLNMGKKYIQMFHFREIDTTQNLLKTSLLRQNVLTLSYKRPVKNPKINILSGGYDGNPVIGQNRTNDTLTVWLPGYQADSIMFEMTDNKRILDTLEMSVKPRDKPGKKAENKGAVIHFTNNLSQGKIKPGSVLRLNFQDPLESYKFEDFVLIEDTIKAQGAKIMFADSIRTKVNIRYPWKEGIPYTLIVRDSLLTDIFGHHNDSTTLKFTGFREEETSSVSLKLDLPENTPYIVQLLDTKEKLIEQYFISQDMTINFKYLVPGKYKLKAIDDRNGNGIWDTGKYLAKIYPERVLYYTKELDLRANWTVEEQWQIPEPGK
ncbi:MAG TPA: Ig-like domain-containing protein [Lentimicrobium sp.]|nr:Ig-like domain-containing protein [Lentimicrobium sp.]